MKTQYHNLIQYTDKDWRVMQVVTLRQVLSIAHPKPVCMQTVMPEQSLRCSI